jgi:hypothetical protein
MRKPMRTVYLVDHDLPPTEEDLAAATSAGAAEVICGIPEALADAGIDTFGYHEIADPAPVVPQSVSMRQARLALLDGACWTPFKHTSTAPPRRRKSSGTMRRIFGGLAIS